MADDIMTWPVERPGIFGAAFDIMVEVEEFSNLLNMTTDTETVSVEALIANWHRVPTIWNILQTFTDPTILALSRSKMGVRIRILSDVTKPIVLTNGVQTFIARVALEPLGIPIFREEMRPKD